MTDGFSWFYEGIAVDKPIVAFITYTKEAKMYVTSPQWESQFLDWLNSCSSSKGYERKVHTTVGVQCCPIQVHAIEKKEATVLKLVKDGE